MCVSETENVCVYVGERETERKSGICVCVCKCDCMSECVCVQVCVREEERERERGRGLKFQKLEWFVSPYGRRAMGGKARQGRLLNDRIKFQHTQKYFSSNAVNDESVDDSEKSFLSREE